MPMPSALSSRMRASMEAFTGPTELHPLRFGPRQTGVDPFPDDAALELCKHAEHLEHRLARRRRCVEPLPM